MLFFSVRTFCSLSLYLLTLNEMVVLKEDKKKSGWPLNTYLFAVLKRHYLLNWSFALVLAFCCCLTNYCKHRGLKHIYYLKVWVRSMGKAYLGLLSVSQSSNHGVTQDWVLICGLYWGRISYHNPSGCCQKHSLWP